MDDESLTTNELRNIFKIQNMDLFDVKEKDTIYRLITRKTVFKGQHQHLFPNGQERPDRAKEDFCWACRSSKNKNIKEDLRHAVLSCPAQEGKRKIVLTEFISVTEPIIPATFKNVLYDQAKSTPWGSKTGKTKILNYINLQSTIQILTSRSQIVKG